MPLQTSQDSRHRVLCRTYSLGYSGISNSLRATGHDLNVRLFTVFTLGTADDQARVIWISRVVHADERIEIVANFKSKTPLLSKRRFSG